MEVIRELEQTYRKATISPVRSGDTVRVHHLIKEGSKQRIQVFEGVVIRSRRSGELAADVTVRRIASGVGVEKTFLLHSPNVVKLEIVRRSKVRRNYLSYLRDRRGKSARLQEVAFDKVAANASNEPAAADEIDEAVTEIDPAGETDTVVVESTDELVAAENEAVSADDDTEATGDENDLAAEETEAGVERVDREDDGATS